MGGWLGLALTSANRRISADFLHHFFSSFSSLLPRQFTRAGYFSDCRKAKGVSPVMWRVVLQLCRNFTCGLPLLMQTSNLLLDPFC